MLELSGAGAGASLRLGFGGDTLNTAVYLARELAGTPASVDYVTALGDDPFSDEMVAAWAAEGLETGLVYRLPGALPGLYVIRTDEGGERRFYYWRGDAAARRLLDDGRDAELARRLAGHGLIYLSAITIAVLEGPARARLYGLLEALASAGAAIAFDSNYRPRLWPDPDTAREAMSRVAATSTFVLPSAEDDALLFGDESPAATAARWRAHGVREVVVKDGAGPCLVAAGQRCEPVAAETVGEVVDTTAAGDSFNGAYLAARLRGVAPADAARRAHALAAWVVRHQGAVVPPLPA